MSNWFILWWRFKHSGETLLSSKEMITWVFKSFNFATKLYIFLVSLVLQIWFTSNLNAPWNNSLCWTSVPSHNSNSFQCEKYIGGSFLPYCQPSNDISSMKDIVAELKEFSRPKFVMFFPFVLLHFWYKYKWKNM